MATMTGEALRREAISSSRISSSRLRHPEPRRLRNWLLKVAVLPFLIGALCYDVQQLGGSDQSSSGTARAREGSLRFVRVRQIPPQSSPHQGGGRPSVDDA